MDEVGGQSVDENSKGCDRVIVGVYVDGELLDMEEARKRLGVMADLIYREKPSDYVHTEFSVTRLVGYSKICPRKVWYEANVPVYVTPEKLWIFNRGSYLHEHLITSVPEKEKRLIVKIGDMEIQGILDGYDPNTGTVYEVKTTQWIPKEVKEFHLEQVRWYAWLLKASGLKFSKAIFLYVSMSDFKVYEVDNLKELTDDEVLEILEGYRRAVQDKTGEAIEDWACKYCEYNQICDKARGKKLPVNGWVKDDEQGE